MRRRRGEDVITDMLVDEETIMPDVSVQHHSPPEKQMSHPTASIGSGSKNGAPAEAEQENQVPQSRLLQKEQQPSGYSIIRETQAEQDEEDLGMSKVDLDKQLQEQKNV